MIQAIVHKLGSQFGEHVESKDYENAIKLFAKMKYFSSLENNIKTKASSLTGNFDT